MDNRPNISSRWWNGQFKINVVKQIIRKKDLAQMEKLYRASFVNSLGGFKSVVLVGTRSVDGQENLAIFNSLFHLGANPALCGLIVRPNEVPRHTLQNILETKEFSINHIRKEFYKNAHQTSARYPANVSEFEAAKLTPEYVDQLFAPFVKESTVKFACELKQKIELDINGTILLIGEIKFIDVPKECIMLGGYIDLEKAGSITNSGLDGYHTTSKIGRLTYAKPNKWPDTI